MHIRSPRLHRGSIKFTLTRDDLTIKEIAHLAGFASPFQFSKTFKQFFRQSPSTCRKIMLRDRRTSGALLAEAEL